MRLVVAWSLFVLIVPAASAGLLQFKQAHHIFDVQFEGELGALDMFGQGSAHPGSTARMQASELTVRWSTTDDYVPGFAGTPTHHEKVFHNATLSAISRDREVTLGIHPINHATLAIQTDSAESYATRTQTYEDRMHVYMPTARTSDVEGSLHIKIPSDNSLTANATGGISAMFWGWNIQVHSDEGTKQWSVGPNPTYDVDEYVFYGTAMQLQAEALDANFTVQGTFDLNGVAWMYDAQASSNQLTLALKDGQETVFPDRSLLGVQQVDEEIVTAKIDKAPSKTAQTIDSTTAEPLGTETNSDSLLASNQEPTGWIIASSLILLLIALFLAMHRPIQRVATGRTKKRIKSPLRTPSDQHHRRGVSKHKFTIRVRSKDVQTRFHSLAVLNGRSEGEFLEDLMGSS